MPTIIPDDDAMLTADEAAEFLTLKQATLARWRWAGVGPEFIKLGGAVRYPLSVLRAFREAARRSSTSADGAAKAA